MQLSDGEKLILLMLSEIYDAQGIEGEIDPNFIREAIFGNDLWAIPWKYSGIPFEDTESPPEVKQTVDIMFMWDVVETAYEHLSEEEKEWLLAEIDSTELPRFAGFDANHDRHYGIARFLIEHLDRFTTFQKRALNSHSTVVPRYLRMESVFSKYVHSANPTYPLPKEKLAEILKARRAS